MPMLDRDGVQLYYEVHGEGPAILLTHGFSATSQMWRPQIEALSATHTLVLWDLRGHGRSASPSDPGAYGETLTMDDMAALLDQVGAHEAVIGGLSLGGYFSLAFHLDHRERTRALLVIDTGPGFKNDTARDGWNTYAGQRADEIAERGPAAFEDRSPEQTQAEHDDLGGLVMAARHLLTQHSPRVIESLPHIEVPTIVVAGADDEPFLAATDYMAAKIPGASKVIVPDAGHAVNLDQPEAFNRAILAFLEEHGL